MTNEHCKPLSFVICGPRNSAMRRAVVRPSDFCPTGYSASRRLKPYDTSVPGRAVHPGDDIWDSIRHACRDTMDQFPGDPADIAAVGLCTIRFCRALLTADGSLAEPVLSWMDERVARPGPTSRPTPWSATSPRPPVT